MSQYAADAPNLGPIKPGLLAVTPPPKETYMRGKHAHAAANRRAAADIETTEATYRQRVVKLTEERDAARSERDAVKAEWQKEVRILRAQLAEGTSPRVEALTQELERVRTDRDRQKQFRVETRKIYDAAVKRWTAHFVSEHGMKHQDALEAAYSLAIGELSLVTSGREKRIADAYGVEVMLAIRKARGR